MNAVSKRVAVTIGLIDDCISPRGLYPSYLIICTIYNSIIILFRAMFDGIFVFSTILCRKVLMTVLMMMVPFLNTVCVHDVHSKCTEEELLIFV